MTGCWSSLPAGAWMLAAVVTVACSRAEHASEPSAMEAPAASVAARPAAAPHPTSRAPAMPLSLSVSSPAFAHQGAIPARYTCEGANVSPPLVIGEVPATAKSLAVVIEDPDAPDPAAPQRVWTHFIAYDLPANTRQLEEGAGNRASRGRRGKNDWGKAEYSGPCPPIGRHRYFVKVYALDTELGDLHEPAKAKLLEALQGHVIASGEMVGTYQKGG